MNVRVLKRRALWFFFAAVVATGYAHSRVDYASPEARAFMQRYAVQGFPTLLVLSAEGQLVRRVPISFDPATLAATLRG